ncbi:MAG: N-acetylglucosamine kinase [Chthonomonadales bacterium]
MRCVLGVDGGQTSTVAVVLRDDGVVLGRGYGGPANHLTEPGGMERLEASLRTAVEAARNRAGWSGVFASACVGLTGLALGVEALCANVIRAERMAVVHDTRIALYSVTLGKPGVVVIAGTGSVAYGENAQGECASCGGWGYLLGDEGSGYWIGLQALNAMTRAADGRGPATSLSDAVCRHLGVADVHGVHHLVYSHRLDRRGVAEIARIVDMCAEDGDTISRRILRNAGKELGLQASLVLNRLGMADQPVMVGCVGGVFQAGRWVCPAMAASIKRTAPGSQVVRPKAPQSVASALRALEALGVAVDEQLLQRVAASLGPGAESK